MAYNIKIYTELQTLSLLSTSCKFVAGGKFLKYINHNTKSSSPLQTDSFVTQKPVYCKLWHKIFTPINLCDIAGHQDELIEFYKFVKRKELHEPVLIIYPSGTGVYRAIELCLLALNYELVFMDTLKSKSGFKKRRNSKFIQIPAYKLERLTTTQLQILSKLHEFSVIFIKSKYESLTVRDSGIDTVTVEIQLPMGIDKVRCKKFIFYPPPDQALIYRIQDILAQLNHYICTEDIRLLLEYCKSEGVSDIESALSRLMFILAGPPKSNENNYKGGTNWYINNHLGNAILSSDEEFEAPLSIDSINDKFEIIWDKLYNSEHNIIDISNRLTKIMWFYSVFTQTVACGQDVPVDHLKVILDCTTTATRNSTTHQTYNFFL